MGEECGQCINYTTGWLGIPSAPRVPIVRESPRVCSRVIRAYVHYVRACVRTCVRTRGPATYLPAATSGYLSATDYVSAEL